MIKSAKELSSLFENKRTYRKFSTEKIPREVLENTIRVALRAPSGANLQPWTFCVVESNEVKRKIREHSEIQEQEFYSKESLNEWHKDLEHLNVNTSKPFLEEAPALICIFYHKSNADGTPTYYASKSTGLAAGMLISALHQVGLASLTYTPQNMKFMSEILKRPTHEVPYLILVVGKQDDSYELPNITKKPIDETIIYY